MGALLLVNRLTEYASPRAAPHAAEPDSPPRPEPGPAYVPPPPLPPPPSFAKADPGSQIVIPAGPPGSGPVLNESPPIQGPVPMPLPEDPEERGAALSKIRANRAKEQMERRNQRNQERLGLEPD